MNKAHIIATADKLARRMGARFVENPPMTNRATEGDIVETYAVKERCEYCDNGWVEGRPWPSPEGPQYPMSRCIPCNGTGWVVIEYEPATEEDRQRMLAAMGEDEDSLMLGGCGGGERDPDLEWY